MAFTYVLTFQYILIDMREEVYRISIFRNEIYLRETGSWDV